MLDQLLLFALFAVVSFILANIVTMLAVKLHLEGRLWASRVDLPASHDWRTRHERFLLVEHVSSLIIIVRVDHQDISLVESLLKPWMVKRLARCDPLFRVGLKHLLDQVLCLW